MSLIPKRPDRKQPPVDEFISGAAATKADRSTEKQPEPEQVYQKSVKFMLEIPQDLRTELKIEAIQKDYPNMSAYICAILQRRDELEGAL